MQGDKAAFLGRFGDLAAPASLAERDVDAALRPPRGPDRGAALRDRAAGRRLAHARVHARDGGDGGGRGRLARPVPRRGRRWTRRSSACARAGGSASRRTAWRRPTPRSTRSTNDWVRYQAIAARLWGRAGYYQQSGAFGFRDQLQDSQVWLTIDPERCRRAAPAPRGAPVRRRLGLPLVASADRAGPRHEDDRRPAVARVRRGAATSARRATCRSSRDTAPYLDEKTPAPLSDHALRAFRARLPAHEPARDPADRRRRLERRPLGDGPARRRANRSGSAQFLAGLLADWTEIWKRAGRADLSARVRRPAHRARRRDQRARLGRGVVPARHARRRPRARDPRATAWAGSS